MVSEELTSDSNSYTIAYRQIITMSEYKKTALVLGGVKLYW